jgi:type I restriction enzyme S subunit
VPESKYSEYLISQSQMKLTVDTTKADPLFLYYIFCSPEQQEHIRNHAIQTGVPHTNLRILRETPIVLPPLHEQQAISNVLGALDDKIELNRRMSETLEATVRALFESRFMIPTVGGSIRAGWIYSELGSVLRVLETGGRPRGGVRDIDSGIPSVGAESIVGIGKFDFSKTKYVPEEFFLQMRRGHAHDGDVLLYKDGGRPGEFEPHVTMVGRGFPFSEFAINEHVYRLRSEPLIPQSYLFFWLSSETAMEEMRIRGTGVAIPGLNSTAVKQLSILVPDEAVLREFDGKVAPMIDRILASASESKLLAGLRDTLLPKLISGKLRIKDAERFVGKVA